MIHRMLIVLVFIAFAVPAIAQVDDKLTFDGKLAAGHAKYLAGDFQGALDQYQEAKEMESGKAIGYYFVACALAKLEKYDESVATFKVASNISGEKDKNLHAKALFMAAIVEERRANWAAAKASWNAYLTYAKGHKDVTTFQTVAEQRIEVIESQKKLKDEYSSVRAKAPAAKTAGAPAVEVEVASESGS